MDVVRKIYHHLLLNKVYITNPGLYFGKTGCLLFFVHYAHLFEDDIHDEIVAEIIDDLFAVVGSVSALDIQHGLCGIGWGMEYILQNRLMEGDSDEILADLDKTIVNRDVKTISSHPDFADILRYVAVRLTSPCGGGTELPFPHNYLMELYNAVGHPERTADVNIHDANTVKKTLETGRFTEKPIGLTDDMLGQVSLNRFPLVLSGLCNGLSGLGIKLMLEKDKK